MKALTHTKGNRSPSLTDTIRVDGAAFDLSVATGVKFKMRSVTATTLKVDATAQVVTPPGTNGQVRYDWAALDVDTDGPFFAWWEVALSGGKTQDTPEFLVVMLEHEPVTRALCSLNDVTTRIPALRNADITNVVAELLELIAAESDYMHERADREFAPFGTNPQTRRFDLSPWNLRERKLRFGDLANTTGLTLTLKEQTGSTIKAIAAADYVLLAEGDRRYQKPFEPYVKVWFPPDSAAPAPLFVGDVLEIAGNWGFPSVPTRLREECAYNVASKYLRTAAISASAAEEAGPGLRRSTYRVTDSFAGPGFA